VAAPDAPIQRTMASARRRGDYYDDAIGGDNPYGRPGSRGGARRRAGGSLSDSRRQRRGGGDGARAGTDAAGFELDAGGYGEADAVLRREASRLRASRDRADGVLGRRSPRRRQRRQQRRIAGAGLRKSVSFDLGDSEDEAGAAAVAPSTPTRRSAASNGSAFGGGGGGSIWGHDGQRAATPPSDKKKGGPQKLDFGGGTARSRAHSHAKNA